MRLIRFLLAISLMAVPAFAQTTLRGRVTDESGAVVPGAQITITGPGSLSRTTASGADGSYAFRDLPAGSYTVHASHPTHHPVSKSPVVVDQDNCHVVQQDVALDMTPL